MRMKMKIFNHQFRNATESFASWPSYLQHMKKCTQPWLNVIKNAARAKGRSNSNNKQQQKQNTRKQQNQQQRQTAAKQSCKDKSARILEILFIYISLVPFRPQQQQRPSSFPALFAHSDCLLLLPLRPFCAVPLVCYACLFVSQESNRKIYPQLEQQPEGEQKTGLAFCILPIRSVAAAVAAATAAAAALLGKSLHSGVCFIKNQRKTQSLLRIISILIYFVCKREILWYFLIVVAVRQLNDNDDDDDEDEDEHHDQRGVQLVV